MCLLRKSKSKASCWIFYQQQFCLVYCLQKPCCQKYNITLEPNVCLILPFIINNKCCVPHLPLSLYFPLCYFFLSFPWAGVHQMFLHVASLTSCFSLCSFILVYDIQSLLLSWTPHSLWLCFSSWFLIKFIFQLSSLFDLHMLIPISVSERCDYFCFDFASHFIWLLHLQVPFSWLPPPRLIYDNAPTCDWLLNQANFFDVFFLTLISYSIIFFFSWMPFPVPLLCRLSRGLP